MVVPPFAPARSAKIGHPGRAVGSAVARAVPTGTRDCPACVDVNSKSDRALAARVSRPRATGVAGCTMQCKTAERRRMEVVLEHRGSRVIEEERGIAAHRLRRDQIQLIANVPRSA
jgi:hypothetical protein